jgi:predicted N-formylglutamate amidohydrolase
VIEPPFLLLRRRRLSRLLICCEHASNGLLPGMKLDPPAAAILRTHWGWDIGIWRVVREVSRRLGATAVGGRFSRLVVDLNRDPSDPTLIRRSCAGTTLPFNRRLTARDVVARLRSLHAPYHSAIDQQLARRVVSGVHPVLISFHSFTPFIHPRRRRFDVGVLYMDHARLAGRLGRSFVAQGFSVRYNRPYSGREGLIYAAGRHGSFHQVPYLELEFNQRSLGTDAACRETGRRAAAALVSFLDSVGPAGAGSTGRYGSAGRASKSMTATSKKGRRGRLG